MNCRLAGANTLSAAADGKRPLQFFIAVVPPEPCKTLISQAFPSKIEPHITIKAQGGLTVDQRWIEAVRSVAGRFRLLHVNLGEPRLFGDKVLYLSVLSEDLVRIHSALVDAIGPADNLVKSYFEGELYVPHLTLKMLKGTEDVGGLLNAAESRLSPYPEFTSSWIRVYRQDSVDGPYRALIDVPLGAQKGVEQPVP
jgi:2'-5' RNA ligase